MGSFEEAKGRIKQALSDLTENDDLEREGEAQVEKDRAQREADAAKAEARGREAEAAERRREERTAQEGK